MRQLVKMTMLTLSVTRWDKRPERSLAGRVQAHYSGEMSGDERRVAEDKGAPPGCPMRTWGWIKTPRLFQASHNTEEEHIEIKAG